MAGLEDFSPAYPRALLGHDQSLTFLLHCGHCIGALLRSGRCTDRPQTYTWQAVNRIAVPLHPFHYTHRWSPQSAKLSIDEGKQVKIAAIDPSFDRVSMVCNGMGLGILCRFLSISRSHPVSPVVFGIEECLVRKI